MAHADASRLVRMTRGILGERFSRSQADAIARTLVEQRFKVRVIASDRLPKRREPRTIRWFEIDRKQMHIPEGIRGETIPLDWSSVFVVSAGQISEVETELVESYQATFDDDRGGISENPATYRNRARLADVLDVIGIDTQGDLRYLRLPSKEINYAKIMGEGTELSRFDRFLALVDYIIEHAPEAIVSPETRKLLLHRDKNRRTMETDARIRMQDQSFRQYNRWLLTKAILREHELAEDENGA